MYLLLTVKQIRISYRILKRTLPAVIAWPTELSFEDKSSLNPGNSTLYCALIEVKDHFTVLQTLLKMGL